MLQSLRASASYSTGNRCQLPASPVYFDLAVAANFVVTNKPDK
jgi:hypothetical protein